MSENRSAAVAGHICLDIIPSLAGFTSERWAASFQPGHLLEVGAAAMMTGGPVSNTGLALHKLGIPTRLMGKVGADVFGQAVLRIVESMGTGLADGMIVDPHSSTSYTVIISPPGIDRIFLHDPGANNTFCAADVNYDQVAMADLFHFGYPPVMQRMYEGSGEELVAIFQRVKALGLTTSLDMAFPDPDSPGGRADWSAILRRVLPFVDIFLPSIEELLFMTRRDLYDALAQHEGGNGLLRRVTPALLSQTSAELIAQGVKIVGLKLGERGLYLRTAPLERLAGLGKAAPDDLAAWAGRELWAPCFQVNVTGTTGSGDATIAGFLAALLRGYSPERATTAAVAVGACNVEAPDALSGLRAWEETLARIERGWPRHLLSLNDPAWRLDETSGLWAGPDDPMEIE